VADQFLTVLNMSLTASYVILFIILVRLPLKKTPKVISYALWSAAAFRLLCPVSFESVLSLVPRAVSPVSQNIAGQQTTRIGGGISAAHSLQATTAAASVNPSQVCAQIGSYIWLAGIAAMLIYSVVSTLILKKNLKNARCIESNLYEANNLKTPFVLGLFRPKIMIPSGLSTEEKSYIIRHEQTHIRRFDHVVKLLAYLILSIHWFNPLVWIAFVLMSTDMELSCDERVLKEMGGEIKKAYSMSLLSLATEKRMISGSALAFGEGNVRARIKNVLNYKKPAFWSVVIAVVAVIGIGVGLVANPRINAAGKSSTAVSNAVQDIYRYRTQYVGDNSKVANISYRLQMPKSLTHTGIELYTSKAPYSLNIVYKTTPAVRASFSKDENQTVFDQNAILMFALIKNADSVRFVINDGKQDLIIKRTRDWANKKMAKDVWESSSTVEKFTALYQEIFVSTKK
jgi:beta-lactamase regulating signal transducer with metallopeptidase domain